MGKNRKMKDWALYAGIISALAVIELHGEDTIYDEVVALCDVDELLACARQEREMRFSGLDHYLRRHKGEGERG